MIPANTEPSASAAASSDVSSKVTVDSVALLKPYDSSWKLYPRPTEAFPVKPANADVATRAAISAIERIFSSIAVPFDRKSFKVYKTLTQE